jgi:ribonuclease PH
MVKVERVLKDHVAAISCGIFAGQPVTDLDYLEDSSPRKRMPISS